MSLKDRFEHKYIKQPNGCWIWMAAKLKSGYGRIRESGQNGKTLTAHRASWLIYFGKIPAGMCVCHKCDEPSCVNPAHLFLGTSLDNAVDRKIKGRNRDQRGEANSNCSLKNEEIEQVKLARARGETYESISRLMKIPRSTVVNICLHTWKHIGVNND